MPEVLVADDNLSDVYLIREALRMHGVDCAVRVASDGEEALGIISAEAPGKGPPRAATKCFRCGALCGSAPMAKRHCNRWSHLTEEEVARIWRLRAEGVPPLTISSIIGIQARQVRYWLRPDRRPELQNPIDPLGSPTLYDHSSFVGRVKPDKPGDGEAKRSTA